MVIRECTAADLPQLLTLDRECFAHPWTESMWQGEFTHIGFYGLIAEENGEPIGYVCITTLFETADLSRIAVKKARRGEGLGRKLLQTAIAAAKERGAEQMFLEVRVSNLTAIKLYESTGFEKTRLRKNYYENGEDGIEMKIAL